ncbi:hypothetical protein H0H81_011418 [Sphagnurus paluster]|uniref:Uncharacterized protein n=1 Tax=Sphagnurus paluster TaxID=117069 RepID=A0A9P7KIB8_9AGAR|nr:hypothetical protein H0H81_011418 [Sphagnurus paluster]
MSNPPSATHPADTKAVLGSNEKNTSMEKSNPDHEQRDTTEDWEDEDDDETAEEDAHIQIAQEPQPPRRLLVLLFALILLCAAISARQRFHAEKKPQIIYATRYSKEHKFRPAASPIITETLKDGRIRIRGAGPTPKPVPKLPRRKCRSTSAKINGSPKRKTRRAGSASRHEL